MAPVKAPKHYHGKSYVREAEDMSQRLLQSSSSFSLSLHPVPSSDMFLLHGIGCFKGELGVQLAA